MTKGDLVGEIVPELELQEDNDSFRFKFARDGDHLMCPFQCDLCQFINVKKRHPANLPGDDMLLLCIRRANLDACWARESSTVYQNMREAVR
eukprot:scaffold89845_cov24-Attheya_sp.AAC.1